MERLFEQIEEHLKELIIPYLMSCLSSMFNCVNDQVGVIASDVARTPSAFSPSVFNMIKNISDTVIMPIAGIVLTFVACYELIQLIISYNNLANFETWFIFKWILKTTVAVELITHTFDFTMAVFDVAQHVITSAGGIISASTAIDASALAAMESNNKGYGYLEHICSVFPGFYNYDPDTACIKAHFCNHHGPYDRDLHVCFHGSNTIFNFWQQRTWNNRNPFC